MKRTIFMVAFILFFAACNNSTSSRDKMQSGSSTIDSTSSTNGTGSSVTGTGSSRDTGTSNTSGSQSNTVSPGRMNANGDTTLQNGINGTNTMSKPGANKK
ncbi:MAG: hypothetical protein M3Z26_03435 [Bacteroidota bacterium]|nr:hypothetical protein [Bacteroidota bacterium]